MKRLIQRYRSDGGADHQETVNTRVRGLTSVSHDLTGDDPATVRQRLNGGRSALASGPTSRVST